MKDLIFSGDFESGEDFVNRAKSHSIGPEFHYSLGASVFHAFIYRWIRVKTPDAIVIDQGEESEPVADILLGGRMNAVQLSRIMSGSHPAVRYHLQGLGLGSLSLMGGVGTSGAIAPTYEALGAENATVLAIMCATFGMVFASLTGGPVARALIKRHHLHGEDRSEKNKEEIFPLNNKNLLSSVCLIIVAAGLGSYIAILAGMIPMIEFPYFIGCMIGGIILRNILDAVHVEVRAEELDAFGDICLEIFLGMTMMTIDVTKILDAIGPFVIIFAAQVITTCIYCYLVTFRCCGRNYDAAVIVAGHIGMGLGNGPNTMANEKAVMAEHGFSHIGWVVYPPFGLLVLDIFNPIFCSVIAEPLTKFLGYMPS